VIRISLRDLQWRRRRFVIVVLVAALAFGLALVMSGVTNQLSSEGVTTVEMFDADHWVVAEGVGGPFTSSQLIDGGLAGELANEPGVTAASPILIGRTIVGERDVNIVGYDPDSPILPSKLGDALSGVGNRRGAIADERFEFAVGERFPLAGVEVPVVAQVADASFYWSNPTVFLPLDVAQDLLFTGQDVASAVVVTGRLDGVTDDGSLDVLSNDDVLADFDRVLAGTSDTIGIVNTLLWLMAAGIVAAIVYVSVLERTRDFATLKAIGTSNGSLVAGLVAQAALISVCSAIAAVGVAKAISPSFSFPVSIPAIAYARLLLVALVVGLLASLAGVRRITRVDPALAFGGAT
jgi:putative ABC transport system permease protein